MDNNQVVSSPESVSQPVKNSKLSISLDFRFLCAVLVLIIVGMLIAWRPWSPAPAANGRTIKVTGDAKITAAPDEFVFRPTYDAKNADKATALAQLTAKSDEITAGLKKLGIPSNKIKTTTNGYDNAIYYGDLPSSQTYSTYFTITVDDTKAAQKVQDYLVTTSPSGSVSPEATFSTTKQKTLESQARDKATIEAHAKAEQSAKNLGFKIGAVKSVEDGSGFGNIEPLMAGAAQDAGASATSSKLSVQPGENDLTYSVTVTYYLR
jgi:uncharacterized protein YggE